MSIKCNLPKTKSLVLLGTLTAAACAVVDSSDTGLPDAAVELEELSSGEVDAAPDAEEPGAVASLSQALSDSAAVGVIPSNRGCPPGAPAVRIRFDDEDSGNANKRGGFIASVISNDNTDMLFCRVDGSALYPLGQTFDRIENHYAVLKLGSVCPNGSVEFFRYFDNEDDGNRNSIEGSAVSIAPNVVNENSTLRFCLFRGGDTTMTEFPRQFFGANPFGYSVFAASNFSRALQTGWFHTDDEDDSNDNSYSTNAAIIGDAQRIISAGQNTDIRIAAVVPIP